jgi:methionine-rich copper-binding protein CopC
MRRLLVAALVLAASWALPVAASAHATLLSVDPHDGSTVSRRPDAVTLRFSEPVQPPVGVVVVGPGGQRVSHGASTTLGDRVTQRLVASATGAGEYTIRYQVLSTDGHVVTGTTDFTVSAHSAGSGAHLARPSAARPSVLVTALVMLLLLMLALAGLARLVGSPRG